MDFDPGDDWDPENNNSWAKRKEPECPRTCPGWDDEANDFIHHTDGGHFVLALMMEFFEFKSKQMYKKGLRSITLEQRDAIVRNESIHQLWGEITGNAYCRAQEALLPGSRAMFTLNTKLHQLTREEFTALEDKTKRRKMSSAMKRLQREVESVGSKEKKRNPSSNFMKDILPPKKKKKDEKKE